MILSYSSRSIFLQQVAKILSHTGHWCTSGSIIPRTHVWDNASERFGVKWNNQQVQYNLPASTNPWTILFLVHVLVKMSGRVARISINAFFLFGFRVSNFNSGRSNMLITSIFIGHLSAGKSFIKWDEISLFIPLNTRQRSAGCSTPDRATFCLFGMILFSENRLMYFLMASICDKSSSHHVTAVN